MQLKLITETNELYRQYLEFRYNVFNTELNRVQSDILEDKYDSYSLHFVFLDTNRNIIGCVRVIDAKSCTLSIEERYVLNVKYNRDFTAEISRLALSKQHRNNSTVKEFISQLLFQLYPMVYDTYLIAAEPSFARILKRAKLNIKEAGALNTKVQPPRQPYVITK